MNRLDFVVGILIGLVFRFCRVLRFLYFVMDVIFCLIILLIVLIMGFWCLLWVKKFFVKVLIGFE